jgi:hypothetical protein
MILELVFLHTAALRLDKRLLLFLPLSFTGLSQEPNTMYNPASSFGEH